ncbi:MAG: RagB/SusD family nutrient uptake outer membrane protein [Proteiniphilum sp.]|nr:RagB/SusD family nutrient uptake outer membrane protein [Proteiniphilum sp.]
MSRTGLLIKRVRAFNPEAATNIKDKHILRPIPQTFIDGLTQNDGSPLTEEQKVSFQNPDW